tara:strand:+ start:235 stop:1422 length:1188 start_codon:yes stop_codon:yes gene_type:complete
MTWQIELQQALEQRQAQHLYRQRRLVTTSQQPCLVVDGEERINFCSNDYLGLATDSGAIEAVKAAIDQTGLGAGASHLVAGHHQAHHDLELALADFCQRDKALYFSTGYMANLGIIQALGGRGTDIFEDRLNHASLIDGALLSQSRLHRYRHADVYDLQKRLQKSEAKRKLVVTDGVFSMDGDVAPLADIAGLCAEYNAILIVDDAHGFGVIGERGGGCLEAMGLSQEQVPLIIGTFGKALGTFGAFAAGSELLINSLIQFARTYIYTTALPPILAVATLHNLKRIEREGELRDSLNQRITQFVKGAEQLGLTLWPSQSPIQPIMLGDEQRALIWSQWLEQQGLWVAAIRTPTVPKGEARLRVTLSAAHTSSMVDKLLAGLGECLRRERECVGEK